VTQRIDAKVAGWAYLSYIAFAMSSSVLFGKAMGGGDISQRLLSLTHAMGLARVTVLMDLLQPVCALVLAVTLYQLVKTVNPTVALLAMVFRVGEGLLGFLPLLGKLELLQLAKAMAAGSALELSDLAHGNEVLHRPDEVFSEFCFVVGGFLFAALFLQGRLIPRWLAWIGVITIGAQLGCVPLHIAGIIPGSVVNGMWLPILLYEVPLGIWLIAKGTETQTVEGTDSRQ
jgi:hypothetical protein